MGGVHVLSSPIETAVLRTLEQRDAALSGRAIARIVGLSQSTAQRALTRLREERYDRPEWTTRVVDEPIAASDTPGRYEVSPRGRTAKTELRTLQTRQTGGFSASRLEARPRTGRTHQIRVHAAAIGHPLLGDRRYGGPVFVTKPDGTRLGFPRVSLHAWRLRCAHPAGGELSVEAPWPPELQAVWDAFPA